MSTRHKTLMTVAALLAGMLGNSVGSAADDLARDFAAPPEATKPRCFWYWLNGNFSKEGITKDLEAMRQAGIGATYIGFLGDGPKKAFSEPWRECVEHAIKEGSRLSVDTGTFCGLGWSGMFGPWNKPEQSMRYMAVDEVRVQGPGKKELLFPKPLKDATPITMLAFPVPQGDDDEISKHSPKISGDSKSGAVTYELAEPFTARSLAILPGKARIRESVCELEVSMDGQNYRSVSKFPLERVMVARHWCQFIPKPPLAISFVPVSGRFFRIKFSQPCEVESITISGAVRVDRYIEKQLGVMCPKSLHAFDYYSWPLAAEPDRTGQAVTRENVMVISATTGKDGKLQWDVPAGDWIVQRVMAVPTKMAGGVGPGNGLEADKMNRASVKAHFDTFYEQMAGRLSPEERKSFKYVDADSWECGAQNWCDDFFTDFQARYGYDAKPWLPVLSGRVIGGADQSDRFLWDLRRMVADRVASDAIGGLRDVVNTRGMKLFTENYGAGGYPSEMLLHGRDADEVGGEFWNTGMPVIRKNAPSHDPFGSPNIRISSSSAHIYGKAPVLAEAYTCGGPFRNTPATLKAQGDRMYSLGINQFILHLAIHQPDDRKPGVYAFGSDFGQNAPWIGHAKAWTDYLRRCTVMLQAGLPIADIAYYITEDAPKMQGPTDLVPPRGFDFDYINSDVIVNRLTVKDGRFVLPNGTSYKLLMLPPSGTMRPKVLQKIKDLAAAGGAVLCAKAPERSPSLQDYPACDEAVRTIAKDLWGGGKIITATNLVEVLSRLKTPPDVVAPPELVWKHRKDGEREIYFVANQVVKPLKAKVSFRLEGGDPPPPLQQNGGRGRPPSKEGSVELWHPVTGEQRPLPQVTTTAEGRVELELAFEPNESYFVVFSRLECGGSTPLSVARLDAPQQVNGRVKPLVVNPRDEPRPDKAVSSDRTPKRNFPQFKPVMEMAGPWEVQFDPQWFYPDNGTGGKVTFEKLEDWTARPEPAIKYYSGLATYRKVFDADVSRLTSNVSRLFLDLGDVRDLAKVRLNGQDLGTVWTWPYRLPVGNALKAGANTLEIEIVTPWINRLLGDDTLPEAQRKTYLSTPRSIYQVLKGVSPLVPSGLIGPVRVMNETVKGEKE